MKKWYLMTDNTNPNLLGGYEDDVYLDYKNDSFDEILQTNVATTVVLYTSDLSWSKKIRCIIQGNTADTQLKSLERTGLFPVGTVKAGMYIFFEKRYWLITGYPGTNGIYEKVTLALCQYNLRWQNEKGQIVERWMNATSASKYDVGETQNYNIIMPSNNFTLLLPGDDESMKLDGVRVFIDRNKQNPTKVFKITRSDDILYDYGESIHGCVLSYIADRGEFNPETDNQELMICDYIRPEDKEENFLPNISVAIKGNNNIKCGFSRTYSVLFTDAKGNPVENVGFSWIVQSNFNVRYTTSNNVIEVFVENDDDIGKTFSLKVVTSNNEVLEEKEIKVIKAF